MNIQKKLFTISTFLVVMIMSSLFLIEAQRTYSFNQTIAEIPTISPSPLPTVTNTEMISPEGSKLLKLEVFENNNLVTNSISINNQQTNEQETVQIKTSINEKLQIPFNTWSPNTFYFFLKGNNEYYVFQSSGELFPSGQQFISINALFNENLGNYTIEEITGWADNTLLVVNTYENDSREKVSFWFDVPSRSFIQLGNYFE